MTSTGAEESHIVAFPGVQPTLTTFTDHLGVNEHESQTGRFIGPIAPGMIGAAQLQSRLRMPGIDADDGQPHLIQLGP